MLGQRPSLVCQHLFSSRRLFPVGVFKQLQKELMHTVQFSQIGSVLKSITKEMVCRISKRDARESLKSNIDSLRRKSAQQSHFF
jgi:hypothetical protein